MRKNKKVWREDEVLAYIAARVDIDPITGCHNWTGGKTIDGYGQITCQTIVDQFHYRGAHRMMMYLQGAELRDRNDQVMHQCHNRSCVNPEHLRIGTAKENIMQAVERGTVGKCKTPPVYLRKVREMIAAGMKNSQIAELIGISNTQVSRIRHNVSWAWVK